MQLDATLALGYVRSRAVDDDYSGMGRQRHLLEQLASQTSGSEVLLEFPDPATVMKELVRTSLSADEFTFLADHLRGGKHSRIGVSGATVHQSGESRLGGIPVLIDALQEAIKTVERSTFA